MNTSCGFQASLPRALFSNTHICGIPEVQNKTKQKKHPLTEGNFAIWSLSEPQGIESCMAPELPPHSKVSPDTKPNCDPSVWDSISNIPLCSSHQSQQFEPPISIGSNANPRWVSQASTRRALLSNTSILGTYEPSSRCLLPCRRKPWCLELRKTPRLGKPPWHHDTTVALGVHKGHTFVPEGMSDPCPYFRWMGFYLSLCILGLSWPRLLKLPRLLFSDFWKQYLKWI